VVTAFIPPSHS